jgi:hypothetical protein
MWSNWNITNLFPRLRSRLYDQCKICHIYLQYIRTQAFAADTKYYIRRWFSLKQEEVRQAISELSRELSNNEIALYSIVLSAEFGQKNLHSTENKSEKNINIKILLQNLKSSSTVATDPVISANISEVNVIFNVILMFEVSRLPATCWLKSKYVYNV